MLYFDSPYNEWVVVLKALHANLPVLSEPECQGTQQQSWQWFCPISQVDHSQESWILKIQCQLTWEKNFCVAGDRVAFFGARHSEGVWAYLAMGTSRSPLPHQRQLHCKGHQGVRSPASEQGWVIWTGGEGPVPPDEQRAVVIRELRHSQNRSFCAMLDDSISLSTVFAGSPSLGQYETVLLFLTDTNCSGFCLTTNPPVTMAQFPSRSQSHLTSWPVQFSLPGICKLDWNRQEDWSRVIS